MSKKSLRVYFVPRGEGRLTGMLVRAWSSFFDAPEPSAFGASEEDVLAKLETRLERMEIEGKDSIDRYLWDEPFQTRTVRVDVHPLSTVKKRPVIGKREIPLVLTYAYCPLQGGGYRVMVPRLGGWFILEDLALAPAMLRHAIGSALMGESPRWIYDFRNEGAEYVREWSPAVLRSRTKSTEREESAEFPTLRAVADDLVERAARGKLARAIGEVPAFERWRREEMRMPPRSLVIIGPPGVGKTAFVRRVAHHFASMRSAETRVPRIWSTSADKILAGMIYLGMWQERCHRLVEELADEGDYLYVDRLSPLLAAQPDGTSIADVLAPSLAEGSISLLAECTESEWEHARRKHPSFAAMLTPIRLEEPEANELLALVDAYASRKGTRIHPAGLRRLVAHLAAFQRDVAFPGKAMRFVDWLAGDAGERRALFYARDIEEAYAKYSSIPLALISDEHPAGSADFAATLKARVIGQESACDACGRLLARLKAGMSDPERPSGTLLFVGPTGVGKTELAKQLARAAFGDASRLVRLDMSEYMLRGSAARLLEARPGTRSLAQQIREQPLSLVLLDEIEKAHPEVFDVLLGLLGEARLTDASGRLVDFRGTIVVMTSNLGVSAKRAAGFESAAGDDFARAVRMHFRPEMFNRIDYVLSFRSLAPRDVERIVDIELAQLATRTGLVRRALRLRVSAEAKKRLAHLGYDPARGARPLQRVIEERVLVPIAARMAADAAFRDRDVHVLGEDETAAAFCVRV